MNKFEYVLYCMRTYLRVSRNESVYETAQRSGLRIETIYNLENMNDKTLDPMPKGSAMSLLKYVDSFIARFPSVAKKFMSSSEVYKLPE